MMIFSMDRDVLLDNLNIIQRGLPMKTPMTILTGIKVEVYQERILMTTSNTDIATQVVIVDASLAVKKEGEVVIPGKFFIDIVRKISSKKIEIALIEERIIVIKADRSEFKLHIMDVHDYPDVDFLETDNPLIIDSKLLKTIIRETNYATSLSEKRPILTGVNFKNDEEKLMCVATDSYRLSQKNLILPNPFKPFNIVIPNKSLEELYKVVDSFNEEIEVFINPNKVLFKFKNILFQTRLLDGTYPDTSRLIPTEFPVVIKFNKDELLAAVDRVSLLSPRDKENNYNIIKLNLRKDKIVEISSTNTDVGDALEEVIPSDTPTGPIIKIAFSSKYLVEALKSFSSAEVTLNFTGEIKPFVIKGELDPQLLHLILPVRID